MWKSSVVEDEGGDGDWMGGLLFVFVCDLWLIEHSSPVSNAKVRSDDQ